MASADDSYVENEGANGAAIAADGAGTVSLATGALTSQSDLDKQMARKIASVPATALSRRTDWNGLTAAQEEERLSRKREFQELAEKEYEHEMQEINERADRLMERLEEQERICRKKLAEADARAIVLQDGRRVLVGEHGEYIEEATGDTLQGEGEAEARDLRKNNSETVAERRKLMDDLARNEEAEEHLRKAQSLSNADPTKLSPEQMKEKETEARNELSIAEQKAKGIAYVEADASKDTVTALAVGPSRTTSYAGTMDGKDDRSMVLQNEFTACATGTDDNSTTPQSSFSTPNGNVSRKANPQPNQ